MRQARMEIDRQRRSVEPDIRSGKVDHMTDTKIAPKTPKAGANADVASGVAQFLTPVVQELVALAVNGKQANWYVRGVNFIAVHELLDVVVAHAQEWADARPDPGLRRRVQLQLPDRVRLLVCSIVSSAVIYVASRVRWTHVPALRRRPHCASSSIASTVDHVQ